MTNSCSSRALIFSQSRERFPGWYGESARFARIPSSRCCFAAASRAVRPSSKDLRMNSLDTPLVEESLEPVAAFRERSVEQRLALELEQVEELEHEASPTSCIAWKLGRPCSSRAQTSPSTTQSGVRSALGSARPTAANLSVKSCPVRLRSSAHPQRAGRWLCTRPT